MRKSQFNLMSLLLGLLLTIFASSSWATNVAVKALFNGRALLEINGQPRVVKAGQETPEGVKLISADTQRAVVAINGKRHTMKLSSKIASGFSVSEKAEVAINPSRDDHYWVEGEINGYPQRFLVDTGATTVAMNKNVADEMGLRYDLGERISVRTASGEENAFELILDSVRIGTVEVRNVRALINPGAYPKEILLGMSFLSRVNLSYDDKVLKLKQK